MIPDHRCIQLVALLLGMLLTQSVTAWAQKPDDADEKMVIESILFEGVKDLNAEAMRAKLGLKEKGLFDEETANSDAETIVRSLRDQGYTYARITKARGNVGKNGRLALTFVIDAGDVYHVGEFKLAGNKALASKQIADKMRMAAGKTYSATDIEEDRKMITDLYGARGYADASVEITLMEIGKGSLRIQYDIDEGKEYQFQAMHISGNARVKEEVIRQEFKIAPGEIFNTALIERGRQALLRTGLFETVEVSYTPNAKKGFKDLEVTVEEKK